MITHALTHKSIYYKDNETLFTVYVPWVCRSLQDKKFTALAIDCLLAVCYQYSPKVIISFMLEMSLNTFSTERDWAPIIPFYTQCIAEFGVHNVFPIRILRYLHNLVPNTKKTGNKHNIYECIEVLYTQLGRNWKEICFGPLHYKSVKYLSKMFNSIDAKRK